MNEGNPARGIAYGLFFSLFFWLIVWLLCGCTIHKTPVQEELWMDMNGEPEITWIPSNMIKKLLPEWAEVGSGMYKLVPRGMVSKLHDAPWCSPGAVSVLRPKDWTCVEYSESLAETMQEENYAFGVASGPYKTRLSDEHMVNIFIDEDREVILYDPQTCQFVRQEINKINM